MASCIYLLCSDEGEGAASLCVQSRLGMFFSAVISQILFFSSSCWRIGVQPKAGFPQAQRLLLQQRASRRCHKGCVKLAHQVCNTWRAPSAGGKACAALPLLHPEEQLPIEERHAQGSGGHLGAGRPHINLCPPGPAGFK